MENFEKLEAKITRIVEVLQKLRQENVQMLASYEGLSNKVFEYEEKTKGLTSQNNQLRAEAKTQEAKRNSEQEKMKRKIKGLIEKIDMFEKMGRINS